MGLRAFSWRTSGLQLDVPDPVGNWNADSQRGRAVAFSKRVGEAVTPLAGTGPGLS